MNVNDKNLQDIGVVVAEVAMEIYERCGAEKDFCIQSVGIVVVFGGTNRLIFSAKNGWWAERSNCTSRFLEAWDQIKGEYGGKGATSTGMN